jgi:hypothetical protein
MTRPIHAIARDIAADWGDKTYFGARPYLGAMHRLNRITDNYDQDSAESVVRYFLSNARNYRGTKAKALKAELKAMLAPHER